jgi:subtilase family serine protease
MRCRGVTELLFVSGVLALMFPSSGLHAGGRQRLSGHRNAAMRSAAVLGDLDPDAPLRVSVGLPFRNQDELQNLVQEVSDPRNPLYRHYLKAQEFADRFGPSPSDYAAVEAYLRSRNLTVLREFGNRALVQAQGRAADLETAFNVRLRRYARPGGGTFFGPDDEPSVDLDVPLAHVEGLSDFNRPHCASPAPVPLNQLPAGSDHGGSGPDDLLMGNDFRNAYAAGLTLTGAGQTIALVEFDTYYASDVAAYQAMAGTRCAIQNVYMDGQSAATTPNPDYDQGMEPSMDIEMACAMAPDATIAVYMGTGSFAEILDQIASDDTAQQVGSSWYTDYADPLEQQAKVQLAAQGQSYSMASGDSGACASDPGGDTDDPIQTLVGGTDLMMSGGGTSVASESAWNDATGASGGGILTNETIPSYQSGMDMSACGGSTTNRNFPDISAAASDVFIICYQGVQAGCGGTSSSCPLWTGFLSLCNQSCGQKGKCSIGFANPTMYQAAGQTQDAVCRNITSGNNGAYSACAGYNLVTGLGSSSGAALLNALVGAAKQLPPTPTPVPPPDPNPWSIKAVSVGPNPNPKYLYVNLAEACDRLELKVYGAGADCVLSQGFGALDAGWNRLDLAPGACSGLPNGVYACSATAYRGKQSSGAAHTRMMVLR